ncbi:MAG: phosphatase PAP2-related protein [Candidatus Nanoarchaeia archaeon]|nr:phosphatase PAP2-related protein [Candidatus Nanoarchaeia archaeon]MDD5587911.1 phosphatase PAP2-related protein [Candidatus Nanoarchaeia archaeon]
MHKWEEWKREIWNHKYLILISLVFLLISTVLDYAAGIYVSEIPGVVAPDLILDNIPTVDLDFIFTYGMIFMILVLFIYPLLFRVKDLHKVISQFSLLIMVRSAFTCFTHLKVPSDALTFNTPYIISFLTFQNDLFFSGHTAIAFLGFLLFKGEKIRYFFLITSIIMGITVLLMHVHYSIDVFSAFFITYGTFKIGKWIFNKINHYNS